MFVARQNGPALIQSWRRSLRPHATRLGQTRAASGLATELLQAKTPAAQQLLDTNLWSYGRWSKKSNKPKGDKSRVNIADEKLCDDIISYIQPTLRRHVGCDLIDIYPGAGVWSRKLHDALQPRSHILLEPDDVYRPFLNPLLANPKTELLALSGIIWRDLGEVLQPAVLPHQAEQSSSSPLATQRNDTLLVTANLSFHPRKRFRRFDSVAKLVLFQFISAIRASSIFQKYGLVRMLLWVGDDDKHALLPRSVQQRRRMAIEGELSTEWITEVASRDELQKPKSYRFARDSAIDMDSGLVALERMRTTGITVPQGRTPRLVAGTGMQGGIGDSQVGAQPPVFDRAFSAELQELEADFAAGRLKRGSERLERLRRLRYQTTWTATRGSMIQELLEEKNAIAALRMDQGQDAGMVSAREDAWNDRIRGLNKDLAAQYLLVRDNLHVYQQSPPVLTWDRRTFEPLPVEPTEFFPNLPCTLLDIQPKAMSPLLRSIGPSSNRAGDIFELLLRSISQLSSDPISKSFESIWPGAAEGVLPHVASLRDPAQGGSAVGGIGGELAGRALNEQQLLEILQRWMEWPFRPSYPELVGRVSDDHADDAIEESAATPVDLH